MRERATKTKRNSSANYEKVEDIGEEEEAAAAETYTRREKNETSALVLIKGKT